MEKLRKSLGGFILRTGLWIAFIGAFIKGQYDRDRFAYIMSSGLEALKKLQKEVEEAQKTDIV